MKAVFRNIWIWGVKPMAVGSAIVGTVAAVIALLWLSVVWIAHEYEYQGGLEHDNATTSAIMTPVGVFIVWLIGYGVIAWREQAARDKLRWAAYKAGDYSYEPAGRSY